MDKFKVGDRIICLVDSPADNESIHKGDTGVICSAEAHDSWIGVCWDKPVDGGHNGFGWRVPIETLDFEPEDDKPPFQFDDEEFRNLFR